MLDSQQLDRDVEEIVDELADSRQCVVTRSDRFAARVYGVAVQHDKGVTNIMGRIFQRVSYSDRFNPTRKLAIMNQLQSFGVGASTPKVHLF